MSDTQPVGSPLAKPPANPQTCTTQPTDTTLSYIDSYKHQQVGLFGNIPVYRPLENIAPSDNPRWDGDFGCSIQQLVIGGGSGEHPGLVIQNPAAAVAEFALTCEDFTDDEARCNELYPLLVGEPFLFAGWGVADYHGFFEHCTSATLPNPFDPDGGISFETWLLAGIGEFIYYAMPDLALETVALIAPLHVEKHHIRYNNITIIPPNMPVYANGGNAFGG